MSNQIRKMLEDLKDDWLLMADLSRKGELSQLGRSRPTAVICTKSKLPESVFGPKIYLQFS